MHLMSEEEVESTPPINLRKKVRKGRLVDEVDRLCPLPYDSAIVKRVQPDAIKFLSWIG